MNEILRKTRLEKGYTQIELGKKAGISNDCICKYELHNEMPNEEIAEKIARALNIPVEKLFPVMYRCRGNGGLSKGIPSKRIPNDAFCNYALRQARDECSITGEELARRVGINRVTYSAYEQLKCCPPLEIQEKIASELGKKREELFPENLKRIIKEVGRERRDKQRKVQGTEVLVPADEMIKSLDEVWVKDPLSFVKETEFEQYLTGIIRNFLQHPVRMYSGPSKTRVTTREKEYLDLYFGLSGESCGVDKIRRRYRVTRQAVYSGINKALTKIKANLESQVSFA